jgi:uncharacterized protein (TIGR03118 family)
MRMHTLGKLLGSIAVLAVVSTSAVAADTHSGRYLQHNLVSNVPGVADNVDPNLRNGWGVAFNPNAVVWVSSNGAGLSTLYNGNGTPQSLVVTVAAAPGEMHGSPTGIVFNGTRDFTVHSGSASAPAVFIFATEGGVIAAWSPTVDPTNALQVALTPGAVYKGLALAANGTANLLYAANFTGGSIDVFDRNFQPVTVPGGFVDPSLPKDFAPFNIQNIQGDLYVSYAKREPGETDEVAGPGLGVVDVFDANGLLIRRVASRGTLNAPWGMALAPAGFGRFANRLLVGNFGDGTINAFDAATGAFKGQLRGSDNRPLHIDGLWGLAFGNGMQNQPTGTLFFAAGPNDENDGLYGAITPIVGQGNDLGDEDED